MKVLILSSLVTIQVILFASCGLDQKEKVALLQQQEAKDDSVKLAALNQLKQEDAIKTEEAVRKAEEVTLALTLADSLKQYNYSLDRERRLLIQINASLYAANDEMNTIRQFHFGRLDQVRESQVRTQAIVIQDLQQQQDNLQSKIALTQEAINKIKAGLQDGN